MNIIRRGPVAVVGSVLLLAILIVFALIWANSVRFSGTNGELIYFRGQNDQGEPIDYRANLEFNGPGMIMISRLSCSSCHGRQAQGGAHMMHMQAMDAPDIRWSVLAGEAGGGQAEEADHDDGHAEAHAGYELADFRMAVVEGKHPYGESLSAEMPRWQITDSDLEDLADFLRSPSLTEEGVTTMFGDFMGGGVWIIFPVIGIIVMVVFMFMMISRGG
jgi:hypothetical protein